MRHFTLITKLLTFTIDFAFLQAYLGERQCITVPPCPDIIWGNAVYCYCCTHKSLELGLGLWFELGGKCSTLKTKSRRGNTLQLRGLAARHALLTFIAQRSLCIPPAVFIQYAVHQTTGAINQFACKRKSFMLQNTGK